MTIAADSVQGEDRDITGVRVAVELPETDTVITFAFKTDSGRGVLAVGRLDVLGDCIGPTLSSCGSYSDTSARDASIQLVVHGVLIGFRR